MKSKPPLTTDELTKRTHHEEFVNAITHGCGFLLSVVAAALLLGAATARGDGYLALGCGIYAATLVGVYAASTLSHYVQKPQPKRLFRAWDQGLIYLLIAGSYTPFALAYLRSGWWWLLIVLMWISATAGFISKVVKKHRVDEVSTLSYVALSWIPMLGVGPVMARAPAGAVFWMGVGGACYIIGVVFLVFDRKAIYLHAVWHILVIAGSAFQYLGIYRCVVA
ncbi:MAG: hemolysin III family protein [Planctomycetia bacterium]|nr:hemolysin III family protein [Planctomycetia bacterium]